MLHEYLVPERLRFYAEVADFCVLLAPRTVIDVGCGTGHLLAALSERLELERIVGVDYAAAGLARARELVPTAELRREDLYCLEVDEAFDLVLCTEVLEHLKDPVAAMTTLMRLCGQSGTVVVTVPDGDQDTWEGHINFWNAEDFAGFLSRFGDASVSMMKDGVSLIGVIKPRATP